MLLFTYCPVFLASPDLTQQQLSESKPAPNLLNVAVCCVNSILTFASRHVCPLCITDFTAFQILIHTFFIIFLSFLHLCWIKPPVPSPFCSPYHINFSKICKSIPMLHNSRRPSDKIPFHVGNVPPNENPWKPG